VLSILDGSCFFNHFLYCRFRNQFTIWISSVKIATCSKDLTRSPYSRIISNVILSVSGHSGCHKITLSCLICMSQYAKRTQFTETICNGVLRPFCFRILEKQSDFLGKHYLGKQQKKVNLTILSNKPHILHTRNTRARIHTHTHTHTQKSKSDLYALHLG